MEWIVIMFVIGAVALMPIALAYDFMTWVVSLFDRLENKFKSLINLEGIV